MFCAKCGAALPDNAKFCADCGSKLGDQAVVDRPPIENSNTAVSSTKKPRWKKISTWVFLFIVGVIALASITTSGLMDPVEAHLQALRNGDIESAYQYTTVEFQTSTPLPVFKKYVAANPILSKHTAFSMGKKSFDGNQGTVTGHLLVEGDEYSRIEFLLSNVDDNWKIQGIYVTSVLLKPVSNHLAALRGKDIKEAYQYTSKEFRSSMSMSAFNKFVESYPVLTKHTKFSGDQNGQEGKDGRLTGYLLFNNRKVAWIDFTLIKEGGDWKIYNMELKKPK